MIQNKECIIREFLMKDNENYNLTSLGFIQDFEKEISFLLELSQDLPMTTFSAWKHLLLNTYYAERQFSAFVQSNINVSLFIENIYSKAQNMVETKYWKESPAEVNTYIAAFKDSLAYLLPRDLFLKYYHYYFTTDLRLNTPEELYYYCQQITDTIFPLSSTEILEHVKNAHPVFCTGISKWLKKLIRQDLPEREDIHHETYIAFIEAIKKNRLATPEQPLSIRNYAIGIIKNKFMESYRQRKTLVLKEENQLISLLDQKNPETEEWLIEKEKILNILQDPDNPLQKELFRGIEDKIEIFILHFVKGLSYEEIAIQKYGNLAPKELKRKTDKFRQDICRVKAPLCSHIEKIISKL